MVNKQTKIVISLLSFSIYSYSLYDLGLRDIIVNPMISVVFTIGIFLLLNIHTYLLNGHKSKFKVIGKKEIIKKSNVGSSSTRLFEYSFVTKFKKDVYPITIKKRYSKFIRYNINDKVIGYINEDERNIITLRELILKIILSIVFISISVYTLLDPTSIIIS